MSNPSELPEAGLDDPFAAYAAALADGKLSREALEQMRVALPVAGRPASLPAEKESISDKFFGSAFREAEAEEAAATEVVAAKRKKK